MISRKQLAGPAIRTLFSLLITGFAYSTQAQDKIFPVKVESAQIEAVQETLTLHGTLRAQLKSDLSLAADGLVNTLNVDLGSQVNQGDLLLSLDDESTRQQWLQAKANTASASTRLIEARRQLEEGKVLHRKKHLAENKLIALQVSNDIAKSELEVAKAQQQLIKHQLEQHQMRAPFSGVVVSKNTELGEWLSSGKSALTLAALDKVLLDVQIPQAYFARIGQVRDVQLFPDTAPGTSIEAEVATVVPFGQQQSRTFLTRFKPKQVNSLLLPGTSARISLSFATGDEAVLISRDAILHHADTGSSVFVIEENKAVRRSIELGAITGTQVQVLRGINPGEAVVIRGNELLRDGAAVSLLP